MSKGANGESKSASSASVPCRHFPREHVQEATSVEFHTENLERSRTANAARARTVDTRKVDAGSARKSRVHHTGPSRVQKASSAHVALTLPPPGAPPQSDANSARSENTTALIAVLKNILSTERSSDSGKAARLAAPARAARYVVQHVMTLKMPVFAAREQHSKHLTMIVDSGAEMHWVCPVHKHLMTNKTKLQRRTPI